MSMQPAAPAPTTSDKLHDLALQAETSLEQLATALAHAGADETATKAVGQCAAIMRKIVAAMGKSEADAPPEPRPTIGSATDEMMAARGQQPPQ